MRRQKTTLNDILSAVQTANNRLGSLENRLDGVESRLFSLEATQRKMIKKIDRIGGDVKAAKNDIKELYFMV